MGAKPSSRLESSTAGRVWSALSCSALLVLCSFGAQAQFSACGDTLALYSPTNLTARFEADPVPGNRLSWDEFDPSLTSCYRLVSTADQRGRVNPQLFGQYSAIYDREITLLVAAGGTVGTTAVDRVGVIISNPHPNPDIPPLNGELNLSNRGGIFRVGFGGAPAVATQSNSGLPNHLAATNITSMATWSAADNSAHRVYAAMERIPLVRSDDGGQSWVETSLAGVDPIGFPITHLQVSPSDPNLIFAGTSSAGLWVSRDGGATFALGDAAIRPPTTFSGTTALRYLRRPGGGNRLFVGMSGIGLFYSDDDGQTWNTITTLRVPLNRNENDPTNPNDDVDYCPGDPETVIPRMVSLGQSPRDPNIIYAGLTNWGVYRSADFGTTWTRANNDLVVCDAGKRRNATVERIVVLDDAGTDRLIVSTTFLGTWYSVNNGSNWAASLGIPVDATTNIPSPTRGFVVDPQDNTRIFAGMPNDGVLVSVDGGGSWSALNFGAAPPYTPRVGSMVPDPTDPDRLIVGTLGAGIYQPGQPLDLSRALAPAIGSHAGADLRFGLQMSFAAGPLVTNETMSIIAQSFQGYAVWRAVDADAVSGEPNWELIGLFDRVNPESCSISGCDDRSPVIQPGCFADKRANCFDFYPDGHVEFFDRDVFGGFTYQYAVSSFDYLFGGRVAPGNFAGDMWFSPRSAQESTPESVLFAGQTPAGPGANYNTLSFQVNLAARGNLDRVFVVPNPLRRQAGWDSGDQSSVRFFNVTPDASCEVFTLSGDLVAELGNVVDQGEQKGIIEWDTRNQSGELVASGVYIYRITNAKGEELIDRFTIIR